MPSATHGGHQKLNHTSNGQILHERSNFDSRGQRSNVDPKVRGQPKVRLTPVKQGSNFDLKRSKVKLEVKGQMLTSKVTGQLKVKSGHQ